MSATAEPGTGRDGGPDRARRRPLLTVLKLVVVLGLFALVARAVPWRDRLLLGEDEAQLELAGRIEGNWRAERVAFVLEPESLEQAAAAGLELPGPRLELGRGAQPSWTGGRALDWRPGLPRVFRELDGVGPLLALFALSGGILLAVTRWWRLLALAGCPTTWTRAVRLTLVGQFFSVVMPGLTGGDLVKVLLAVRDHPERRADAAVSVVVDRLIGLVALLALAAAVVLASGPRFAEIRLPVLVAIGGAAVALWVLLSPRSRRLPGLAWLTARLPQRERIDKLDAALQLYARHPLELALAFVLSIGNHACAILAAFAIGRAFGDALPLSAYAGIVPVVNTAAAIPIAPAGWGVGEAVFGTLFALVGSSATLGVAVSVTYRLCNVGLWAAGGVVLFLPGRSEVEGALERARAAD